MDIFKDLQPPDEDVFYRRNDPNDIRLGEKVFLSLSDYKKADVVLLGCPQDEGIRRNKGREGARFAPAEIRRALYRYPVNDDLQTLKMIDIGDVVIQDSLEQTHDVLSNVVSKALNDGKTVVVLGGGNDISYPDCMALSKNSELPLILNIDRHLDVRADKVRNSGTPYRQLLEEGFVKPEYFHEIGINSYANSIGYRDYVLNKGAHIHYLGDMREKGVGKTVRGIVDRSKADTLFFGFDMDVVRAVEAPGVSDPSPMGLTAREICEIADVAASDKRTKIIEITEVNPEFDVGGITCKLAANIIVRSLAQVKAG